MEKNSKALGYGPNSPIYRLAKKKNLRDDEHDVYMEIVKSGKEGNITALRKRLEHRIFLR